jgi:hypothetical protein
LKKKREVKKEERKGGVNRGKGRKEKKGKL